MATHLELHHKYNDWLLSELCHKYNTWLHSELRHKYDVWLHSELCHEYDDWLLSELRHKYNVCLHSELRHKYNVNSKWRTTLPLRVLVLIPHSLESRNSKVIKTKQLHSEEKPCSDKSIKV